MLWNAKNGEVPISGTAMAYVRFGHGKRSLIVLPGLSDGLATVRGKALLLAPPYREMLEDFTVWMFSRRDVMPEHYAIRDMARDQVKALHRLGIRRACFLGVSQGGMIAQCIARDYPETVDRLVLAVTAPEIYPPTRKRVENWIRLAKIGDHRRLMTDTAEHTYSPAYLRRYRLAYPLLGMVGRPKSYDRFLINAQAILDFEGISEGAITCPTLVIGGNADEIVGHDAAQRLHGRIPGSLLHVYCGIGHAPYEEAPDFYSRVYDFIKGETK